MKKRQALLAGSSGLVGSHLLRQLLDDPDYEKVTIFNRYPQDYSHQKLEEVIVNFIDLNKHQKHFKVDDVFSTLGATMKTAKTKDNFQVVDIYYPKMMAYYSQENKARNFLTISSINANPDSNIFYLKVKGNMEKTIKNFNIPSIQIFRPSFIIGKRDRAIPFESLLSLICRFTKKYKPIKAQKLAKAMIAAAKSDSAGIKIYEPANINLLIKKLGG